MKLEGILLNEMTPQVNMNEIAFTMKASDCHRGGGMVVVLTEDEPTAEEEQKENENGR